MLHIKQGLFAHTTLIVLAVFCLSSTIPSPAFAMENAVANPNDNTKRQQISLKRCPKSPNCVNSLFAKDKKHYIEAITLNIPLGEPHGSTKESELKDKLLSVLKNYKGAKIISTSDTFIKCEFKSGLWGFVDDVEFLISADKIDVRSASRKGYHDMGANRKRIEKIRKAINR